MYDLFIDFWRLHDPNVRWVLFGSIMLGASAGVIGSFAFLRKRSLTGDALAHAALPGVTTAFMLTGSRDPIIIGLGAMVSCFVGYLTIEYLVNRTRIKEDSAFAIVLSLFFALGIFQLTRIQKIGLASQAGLDKLLFGQAAGLGSYDVKILALVSIGLLCFIGVAFRQLKAISFDRQYAQTIGIKVVLYELLLAVALVLAVVTGLQLVGVVLMAAILLTPAAAGRYWTDDLKKLLWLAGLFGALSGIAGANISYLAPRMPTGPWMVVAVTTIFAISFLMAPRRGLLGRIYRQNKVSKKITEENLLRTIFKIGESQGDFGCKVDSGDILNFRNMKLSELEGAIQRLHKKKMLSFEGGSYSLTNDGLSRAKEVTRFHRLWELYLTKHINVAQDHVHDEAEDIEHIITPELEKRLLAELDSPVQDPHGRTIPSSKN